jgi:L-2-hydroxyglutarate oxidase LhgO
MNDFDAIVLGAGAVGLACAMTLSERGMSTLVLESAAIAGTGNSSRNSEVIHAGFYYSTGSLKHRMCVEGRRRLYSFLEQTGVPYRKCGKIVVATSPAELETIERLAQRAQDNEVEGVSLITAAGIGMLEPEVASVGGLLSSETGVFDSHAYMLAMVARIEANGSLVAFRSPFVRAEVDVDGFRIWTGGADPACLTTCRIVNCAGLGSHAVARLIEGLDPTTIPAQRFAKGSYFGLAGRAPFRRLIYPAPVDGGLGVHATLDLSGRIRFGPDVEWLPTGMTESEIDFSVELTRADSFYEAIRRYWPGLRDGDLFADYAGCRPKLSGPGVSAADFVLQTESDHGLPGLVNLYGIESPGLTSSLALADSVAAVLQ